jgi:hypothetical protein
VETSPDTQATIVVLRSGKIARYTRNHYCLKEWRIRQMHKKPLLSYGVEKSPNTQATIVVLRSGKISLKI